MQPLTLEQASHMVDAALRAAREAQYHPMTVAVLDAGGHLLAFKREDNSGILRPQIAQAKAYGALGMGHGSRMLAGRAESHPAFYAALNDISQGRIAPVAGGVLVRGAEGQIIGAVGISGDLPAHDEACAVAGITAAGLVADGG